MSENSGYESDRVFKGEPSDSFFDIKKTIDTQLHGKEIMDISAESQQNIDDKLNLDDWCIVDSFIGFFY